MTNHGTPNLRIDNRTIYRVVASFFLAAGSWNYTREEVFYLGGFTALPSDLSTRIEEKS